MASKTGSLTTTGSVTLDGKLPAESTTLVQISGTFTVTTFVIEGSFDGTVFFPLVAIAEGTGVVVTGTISPVDSTSVGWRVPSEGLVSVRARTTAVGTGTPVFGLTSGSFSAQPFISLNNSGSATITAFNATVGASTIALGTNSATAAALPAGTGTLYPVTAADDTVGVIISTSDQVTGRVLIIGNNVSNKILKIYPPTGGVVNGAAANAAYSTASGKGAVVVCLSGSGNTWLALG
jgi:hypothetical protein